MCGFLFSHFFLLWVRGKHWEIGRQKMDRDGRNGGKRWFCRKMKVVVFQCLIFFSFCWVLVTNIC